MVVAVGVESGFGEMTWLKFVERRSTFNTSGCCLEYRHAWHLFFSFFSSSLDPGTAMEE
jgi:hypothetical protein